MQDEEILIAAYGTLRQGFGNSRLIDSPGNFKGTGTTVEKYTMRASGIPFVSREPRTNIVVDVYKVNSNELNAVDRLEGHPSWYKRELIPVKLGDDIVEAWLYFNSTNHSGQIVATGDYKDHRYTR